MARGDGMMGCLPGFSIEQLYFHQVYIASCATYTLSNHQLYLIPLSVVIALVDSKYSHDLTLRSCCKYLLPIKDSKGISVELRHKNGIVPVEFNTSLVSSFVQSRMKVADE
ncbi:hypothetical protein ACROYT_G003859 [Oculina patagonica]